MSLELPCINRGPIDPGYPLASLMQDTLAGQVGDRPPEVTDWLIAIEKLPDLTWRELVSRVLLEVFSH